MAVRPERSADAISECGLGPASGRAARQSRGDGVVMGYLIFALFVGFIGIAFYISQTK